MAVTRAITVTKSGRRTKVAFGGLDWALTFEEEADDPRNVRLGLVHPSGGGIALSVVVPTAEVHRAARELLSIAGGTGAGARTEIE